MAWITLSLAIWLRKNSNRKMAKFSTKQIKGVIPAMLTPFNCNEELDLQATVKLTKFLCSQNISGLYLTGSTGEGFMMSVDERKTFVEAVINEVNGSVPIIVHVGAISTKASAELSKHARDIGADAISSVPPIYWRFTDDEVKAYYEDLVQASGLPMIVYNIALAGLVSFDMIKELTKLDGVEGIKYTSSTLYDVFRIKEYVGPDFMVYSGSDELAISGLSFGADGLIGSTYNLLANLFVRIWDNAKNNNMKEVAALQQYANRYIFTFIKHNLMPVMKYLLKYVGIDNIISRRPFERLTTEKKNIIDEDLKELYKEIGACGLDFMEGLIND